MVVRVKIKTLRLRVVVGVLARDSKKSSFLFRLEESVLGKGIWIKSRWKCCMCLVSILSPSTMHQEVRAGSEPGGIELLVTLIRPVLGARAVTDSTVHGCPLASPQSPVTALTGSIKSVTPSVPTFLPSSRIGPVAKGVEN